MLVLASASPRRQDLLRNAGIAFTVQPADIDETALDDELPLKCAERLARKKALAVSKLRPHDLILGADTVVVVDDTMLAKPIDAEDAFRMLRMLSGRVHRVITGVCMIEPPSDIESDASRAEKSQPWSTEPQVASEITLVTFNELSDRDIRDYVATGEPMDKAGAYAIQGIASRWIPRIEGDYSNVVGLPVALVSRMLRERKFL